MDMNTLFQEFVTVALRESLRVSPYVLRSDKQLVGNRFTLQSTRRVKLEPDLTWWEGGVCVFVGDAKYKSIEKGCARADLYQMLAYATAFESAGLDC